MIGYEYPTSPHVRQHGPEGYKSYDSYRDWLRDEFTFRCVYCLHREQWYNRTGTFNIDHFVPVTVDPNSRCEYSNLLYACASCNNAKRAILDIPDPCSIAFHTCLKVKKNGEIDALNKQGRKLRDVLRLNSDNNVLHRSRWIRTLTALKASDPTLFKDYMGFPQDLPDLRRSKVTKNTNPNGVSNCYFVKREKGVLPDTY